MINEINTVSNFAREKNSKALLNTDESSLTTYKNQLANSRKIKNLSEEIFIIKKEVEEIKQMLLTLTNGKLNG